MYSVPRFFTISPTHIPGKKEYAWNRFLEGGYIAIGWSDTDYTGWKLDDIIEDIKDYGYSNEPQAIEAYTRLTNLKPGDYVAVTNSNKGVYGLGILRNGELKYEKYKHDTGSNSQKDWYSSYVEVDWVITDYFSRQNLILPGEKAWEPYGTVGKLHQELPSYIKRLLAWASEAKALLVTLTWNSNDWREPSQDKSNHDYIKQGNIGGESWNFDFENTRNTRRLVYGYAKFTAPPKLDDTDHIFIFYSQGAIVGVYGKARLVYNDEVVPPGAEGCTIKAEKEYSLVFPNKLFKAKEAGYLESLQRVGQIGFSYLQDPDNVNRILVDAAALNLDEATKIEKIRKWYNSLIYKQPTPEKNKPIIMPLNQIIYGPPGTGKTYTLANDYYPKFTETVESIGEEEVLRSFVQDYAWWQVIAAALLTSDGFSSTVPVLAQHPLIQAKFNPSKKYPTPNHILWQQLQSHTVATSTTVGHTNRAASHLIFDKSEDAVWHIVPADISVAEEIGVEKLLDYKNLPTATTSTARQHYTFVTFHQSFSYEDFIEGIKPVLGKAGETETAVETDNEISYEIRKGIFYKACLSALYLAGYRSFSECLDDTKENRKQRFAEAKPYGLFIDEINRANVSNVLGELITLIEDDKRLGKEQELWASLPYSQEQFGVPANLYLIGTMNTADRSVEALDTALRRRFMFEEMPPQPQLLSTDLEGVNLQKLLTAINERIELLLDRDHCIGHSYFINLTSLGKLREAFSRAIIPLLQEYFFGHWSRIGMVLGKRFVVAKPTKATLSGFDDEEAADLLESRKLYAFTDPATWDAAAFTSIYNTGKVTDTAEG